MMTNRLIKTVQNSIKHWYALLIVGLIFIGLGVWTFTSPVESYVALSFVFSISFLLTGMLEIFFSVANRNEMDSWGFMLGFGIVNLIIGGLMFVNPEISMTALPFYVGFVILFRSVAAISSSIDLKSYGEPGWGGLMLLGVFGALFSFILLWNPVFAGLSIVMWTAAAFVMSGIFSAWFSLKLRELHQLAKKHSDDKQGAYEFLKEELEMEKQESE